MVLKGLLTSAANTLASFKNGNAKQAFVQVAVAVTKSQHRRRSSQEVEADMLKNMFDAHNAVPLCKAVRVEVIVNTLTEVILDCANSVMNLPSALTSRSLTDNNGQGSSSPTFVTKAPVLLTGSTAVSEPSTPPLIPTLPVTSTTNSSSPSLSINDFIPKKFIGRGAFGEVYLVQGKRSREPYALKVIRKENLRHPDYENIFQEQRIMKTVAGSSHSVHLKASFQDSDNYYILTDYLSGGDLADRLENGCGQFSTTTARRYLTDMILAVEELHNRRVIHRDLKPNNVLIDGSGRLVLADFGISAAFGDSFSNKPWEAFKAWSKEKTDASNTSPSGPQFQHNFNNGDITNTPCGTVGFIAPEVFSGQYSYECDIWSLGVVLYIMLLGCFPFEMMPGIQSTREIVTLTQTAQLVFEEYDEVDEDAQDLLHKMLEKDPSKRITISQIKAHPFFKQTNWGTVANRKVSSVSCDMKSKGGKGKKVQISTGTPYPPGAVPHPWFDYTSPELLVNSGEMESKVTRGRVAGKVLDGGVVEKLKRWWRRRGSVGYEPCRVGGN